MLQFIKRTESIKTEQLNCLVYGEPGIGKTSLVFTSAKPLLIDFDSGLQRACYRLDSVKVEKWEDVKTLQESKELTEFAPRTLIIDTVGAMLDNYIADYVKRIDPKNARRGGELSLQGYGAMKNIFQQFLDWAKMRKIYLDFVAHVTEEREGDNIKYIPKVTGGSYDILRQTMDLIGYMSSSLNKRVIDFRPIDNHIGKDCANIGQIEVPDYKKPEFKNFFGSIIDRTLDRMNALSENQLEIVKLLDSYKDKVGSIQDVKGFNDNISEIAKTEDKAIQLQMFEILKKEASEKGIGYDKTKKQFEDISDVQT